MLFLATSDSLSYILWKIEMCPEAVKQVINALINLVKRQTLPRYYQRNTALKLPAVAKIFVDHAGIYYIFCRIECFSFCHCTDWQFVDPRCAS